MKKLYLRPFLFSESRIALAVLDVLICKFALTLSLWLFPSINVFLGKPSLSKEVFDFINLFSFRWIVFLPLLNYVTSGIKKVLGGKSDLGYAVLAFNTGLYGMTMALVFQKQGFQLKTFWMFSIFIFYGVLVVGRLFLLRTIFKLPWKAWLSKPFLERILKLHAYFKKKPSAYFTMMFMIFLLGSVILLKRGNQKGAEDLAVWGYLALVMSVVIEWIMTFRRRDEDDEQWV